MYNLLIYSYFIITFLDFLFSKDAYFINLVNLRVSRAQEKPSRTGAHARIAGYSINPRIYERGPLVLI